MINYMKAKQFHLMKNFYYLLEQCGYETAHKYIERLRVKPNEHFKQISKLGLNSLYGYNAIIINGVKIPVTLYRHIMYRYCYIKYFYGSQLAFKFISTFDSIQTIYQ